MVVNHFAVVRYQVVDFRISTRRGSLMFGFHCAKAALASLVNGRTPCLCNRENSTAMSPFRLIGVAVF